MAWWPLDLACVTAIPALDLACATVCPALVLAYGRRAIVWGRDEEALRRARICTLLACGRLEARRGCSEEGGATRGGKEVRGAVAKRAARLEEARRWAVRRRRGRRDLGFEMGDVKKGRGGWI